MPYDKEREFVDEWWKREFAKWSILAGHTVTKIYKDEVAYFDRELGREVCVRKDSLVVNTSNV